MTYLHEGFNSIPTIRVHGATDRPGLSCVGHIL